MTADRLDQLAEALRRAMPTFFTDSGYEVLADALLPVVDRMIRQAQAEALESAAEERDHRGRRLPGAALNRHLRDRAAALRASTRGTDQPLGDETTPAGTRTARERDEFRHERNQEGT